MKLSRLQFSLAGLAGAVAIIAIACTALRFASELWASAAFSLAIAILLFAMLAIACGGRETRAFWGGFAFCGWAYLICAFGPWFEGHVKGELVTTHLLRQLYARLSYTPPPPAPERPGDMVAWVKTDGSLWIDGQPVEQAELDSVLKNSAGRHAVLYYSAGRGPSRPLINALEKARINIREAQGLSARPSMPSFERVGHSLLALLAGLIGAFLADYLSRRATKNDAGPQTEPGRIA